VSSRHASVARAFVVSALLARGIVARAIVATALAACGAPQQKVEKVEPAVISVAPADSRSGPAIHGHAAASTAPAPPIDEPIENDRPLPEDRKHVGAKAPGFSIDSVNGAGRLQLLRGRVTVVHFFASWCEPCKKTLPQLELLSKNRRDVVVIGISVDDEADHVADYAVAHGVTFPIAWDDGHRIADKYRLDAIPSTYVIDRAGVVRYTRWGFREPDNDPVEKAVEAIALTR
jgi:thiol-disulfide isomerase/thioredoxin